jgi:hypothetical protein
MAMFGWSRISMAEVYTKEASKKVLARAAAERIADKFSPHLKTDAPHLAPEALETKAS